MAEAGGSERSAPRVWVLLGEGAGGNAQMCALADGLGWPWQTRQLHWNRLNHLPNPMIGARAFTLDPRRSDRLAPPWPDLVIAASRRSAPIARWIKAQSGGITKLVHLLHTQMPLAHFDLVVTQAQFRLPDAANVLRTTLPLNRIGANERAAAGRRWAAQLAHLPRPWLGVLVGGNSSSHRLDASTASRLGFDANADAAAAGGSLLITTSRRTPAAAARAVLASVTVPHHAYRWQAGDVDNPYAGYLALADRFIVTGDSASLPSDACATGRPVRLFEWAPKNRPRRPPGRAGRIHDHLVYTGWIKPRRDFAAFHAGLRHRGLVDRAPADRDGPPCPPDDLVRSVAAVRVLMGRRGPEMPDRSAFADKEACP